MMEKLLGLANAVEAVWVHLKSGDTIKGVLVQRQRHFLILRAAQIGTIRSIDHAELWTKAQGDIVIPMDNVDYYQTAIPLDSIVDAT